MAGSACYNIVYMREGVGTSNTYRVTGGDGGKRHGENNSLWLKSDTSFLPVFIQKYDRCRIYSVSLLRWFITVLWGPSEARPVEILVSRVARQQIRQVVNKLLMSRFKPFIAVLRVHDGVCTSQGLVAGYWFDAYGQFEKRCSCSMSRPTGKVGKCIPKHRVCCLWIIWIVWEKKLCVFLLK